MARLREYFAPFTRRSVALFTRFLHEQNIVVLTAHGSLRKAEVKQCVEQYANHPSFSPDTDILIDLEEGLEVESDFVEGFVEADRLPEAVRENEKYFVAGVTHSPEHEEIMRAISEEIDTPFELETFDELAIALHWLNLKREGRR